jgi:cephalosporin hydroxylase
LRRHYYQAPLVSGRITRRFHRMYYYVRRRTWRNTRWLGVPTFKCPLDLWIYQELLHDVRPDLVIETGTAHGGSALYLGCLLDILDHGRVVSVDLDEWEGRREHPRVTYVQGSSTAPEVVERVRAMVGPEDRVMVILDSDHSRDHVLEELRAYGPLVSRGSYCVVEDSNVGGHPVFTEFGPGPMEAIEAYLKETDAFEIDREREKFFLTFNPSGYLKRVG